jgi:hypothetical protein
MSVLANQTNATPGDAFFWRVNASTITANSFSSDRVLTNTLSTGTLAVGNISTTGSIVVSGSIAVSGDISTSGSIAVSGDITAQNVTVVDTLDSYFGNFEYVTTQQGANIGGLLIASNIAGYNTIFYPQAVISTISTSHIILDGNQLDTGGAGPGAVLLLNGYPIATTSTSISSLTDWSFYPAITDVFFENNNLTEVGLLQATDIQTSVINASNVDIAQDLTVGGTLTGNIGDFIQINAETITPENIIGQALSISSISATSISTFNLIANSGNIPTLSNTSITSASGNITNLTSGTANLTTANITTANVSQVNTTNELVSGTLTVNEVRGVNGFINVEVANRIRMRVLGSIDPFSSPNLDFEAGGGNRGIVNLIANPGDGGIQGEVNITAKGGTALGYATGGLLSLTATRGTAVLGTANTSRVNISADSITSYAGGPTPFVGVLGYNFVYGLLGVNIVAGTPPSAVNVPGTVYLYGLNPLGTGSSGGVRINNGMSIDVIYPYPQGFNTPPYDLFIRGTPSGQKVTLCNVRYLYGDGAEASGFNNINGININGTNLNGTTLSGTNLFASNVNVSSGTISSITSLNGDIQRLFNVSTINGFTVDQLVSTVTPPQFTSTTSTFQQLFTSSLQAVNISSITANITQISGLSTLNGYTVEQLISSVSPLVFFSTVSSFQQLYTSSLEANTISTNTLQASQILLNGSQLFPQQSTTQQLFTSSLAANTISTGLLTISTINGYNLDDIVNPQQTSTFLELFVSTGTIYNASNVVLLVSSINGFNTNQFLSSTGIPPQTSTFSTITTDTLQANQISSGAVVASTFNGYTIQQLLNPVTSTISTFQQFFTSSLQANNISTNTANILSLFGVSTINGFTIADFVSSVSPQPPIPSTVLQFYTSSLAANVVTNYQTSNLNLVAPTVAITTGTLNENADNYNLTVTSNIDINSSNAISIYTTNTAPPVATDGIYILGQGDTSIGSQTNTNITAANNILVNAVATTGIQGQNVTVDAGNLLSQQANYVSLIGSNQILLTSPEELRASSSNLTLDVPSGQSLIYLNQDLGIRAVTNKDVFITAVSNIALSSATLTINGAPYGSVVSSFSTLATNTLTNNEPSPSLNILSRVAATISTGNTLLIDSGEILTYSRSLIDFFAMNGIALSTQTINLDAINTNVEAAFNAPQIFTSSIVGNTASNSLYFGSTIHTNTIRNNDSINFDLNLIAAYFNVSSINTYIETAFFNVIATEQVMIAATDYLTLSSLYTEIDGNLYVNQFADIPQIVNLSSINGLPYTPGGSNTTISTFQQLFTSSIVVNTINGAAYPPPATTVSTFSNLYVANVFNNASVGNNITLTATQTLAENAVSITRTATGTIVDTAPSGYTLNSQSNITISTIGSINLNCVPPSNVIITPTQFATGQIFPQPGLGRYQFLTNNSAVSWTNVLLTDSFANVYYNAAWSPSASISFPITVTIGTSGYYDLKIEYPAGTFSEYLVQYQPDGTILYGIVTPTTANFTWGQGSAAGTINLNARETNITGVSSINLTSPSLLWNGNPIGSGGGGPTVSTFQQLFTSSILTNSGTFQNIYVTGGSADIQADQNLTISATDALTVATANGGLSLTSLSNDIQFYPRVLNPTGSIIARGNLNLSNNNISNVNTLTATNLNATNIVSISTFTSSLTVYEDIVGQNNLLIYGKNSLQLVGELAMVLATTSNDILLTPGILHPGDQNVVIGLGNLNLCNNSINNVDVLNAGNINTTNTTTTNLYATQGSISSLTVSTINTYPVHKAFGSAWATTDPASLALLAGIVNYVDIPTREAFNFVPDTTGNVFSLFPSSYPLNRGIYQLNARCTFSNGDSNLATVSSWIDTVPNVSTTGTAISRCVIQIEPGRIGTTYMVCQSLVDEFISVNCFTTSDNITLYYDNGDGSNTPPSYAMNLTAHQLYQYENRFEEYNWPPNPIPPPSPPPT